MVFRTQRLILRNWKQSDAEDLFFYASDGKVGPRAGWRPHKDAEESRTIIKKVLSGEECYAICLRRDGRAIGSIELITSERSDLAAEENEYELGYWIGRAFWGQGLVPEAARAMLRHAFADLGAVKVWCGYYDGNGQSKRVQDKLGFKYQWTTEGLYLPQMDEKRTGHVNLMTLEDYNCLYGGAVKP